MPAQAPARAKISKTLVHGLVSIEASFYAGAEDSAFQREEYAPDGRKVGRTFTIATDETALKDVENTVKVALDAALKDDRITQAQYDRATGGRFSFVEKIDYGTIIKAVDTEAGLVAVTDAELAGLDLGFTDGETKNAKIVKFLPLSILGTGSYVPESIMQVRPKKEKGRVNAGYEKAFALLMKGMRSRAVFALVEYVAYNKVKYGALMSTGRMWDLKYDDEVREDLPLPSFDDLDPDEIGMMCNLIDTATEREPLLLEDVATHLAWEFVEAKIEAGDVFVPRQSTTDGGAKATDLLSALTASVEAARNKED